MFNRREHKEKQSLRKDVFEYPLRFLSVTQRTCG